MRNSQINKSKSKTVTEAAIAKVQLIKNNLPIYNCGNL